MVRFRPRARPGTTSNDDPIEFELFRNALFAIADEMALTVFHTAYSGVLKDNMDYSTAFCDADGKLVAQGPTLPGHLGSIPTALDVVVAKYRDDMVLGEVFRQGPAVRGRRGGIDWSGDRPGEPAQVDEAAK